MAVSRREFLEAFAAAGGALTLAACGQRQSEPAATEAATEEAPQVDLTEFEDLAFDMKSWHYDAEHAVWWQVGLTYCVEPATKTYEGLGIYVPGAYLKPTDEKADLTTTDATKTFECEVDATAMVGQYTAATAPILMPVNARDFAAQKAPAAYLYDGLEPYLAAGAVYVFAGCRGRSNGYDSTSGGDGFFSGGAPWAVTDLKAAVRYLRYNRAVLPGSTDRITLFGFGAGASLASVVGATGNAAAYDAYLEEIGSATHDVEGTAIGDEIAAVACWCPEPVAARADAAYEWELGQFFDTDTRAEGSWTRLLSNDLAAAWAEELNSLALRADDTQLSLDETDGGIYTDGSYYEYLVGVVEGAAADFFNSTAFPYTLAVDEEYTGEFPGSGEEPVETLSTPAAAGYESPSSAPVADTLPTEGTTSEVSYDTRADYVTALNSERRWITYNERRGTVRVSELGAYVRSCRTAALPVCGYDAKDRSGAMNQLFGNDDSDTLHFSAIIAELLTNNSAAYEQAEGWEGELPSDWAGDLAKTDALGQGMQLRRSMYDPLHYLSAASEDYGTAQVAAHWRVNAGLADGESPLAASANLAAALGAYEGVDVAYTPVWGRGHVLAERGGADATEALVSWLQGVWPAEQAAEGDGSEGSDSSGDDAEAAEAQTE